MSAPIPSTLYTKVSDLLGTAYVPVNAKTGAAYDSSCPRDAAAAINAWLAQTTASRPALLDLDIGIACYGSILIPSTGHVSIIGRGWDTGIFMMPGSNSHAISNETGRLGDGNYVNQNPNSAAPAQSCVNVRIANLFINGNRGTGNNSSPATATPTATTAIGSNQLTSVSSMTGIAVGQLITGTGLHSPSFVSAVGSGTVTMVDQNGNPANATANGSGVTCSFWSFNSTTGDARGITTPSGGFNAVTWYCGVNLVSALGIELDRIRTYNIPTFAYRLGNISQFDIDGVFHDGTAYDAGINCDGIHIDGPASLGTIRGVEMNDMIDDCIALNCPEGYGGNISQIAISDTVLNNAWFGIFGYTTLGGANPKYVLSDVAISNVEMVGRATTITFGTDFNVLLRLGYEGSPNLTASSINNILVSNCIMRGGGGTVLNSFMEVRDSCGIIKIKNCVFVPTDNGDIAISLDTSSVVLADLDAELLIGSGGALTSWTALSVPGSAATGTISRAALDIQQSGTTNMPYLIDPTNLAISDLEIKRLTPTYVTALINGSTWTNLPKIRGAGVVGSLFQIPDAQMVDGCMYVSNTSPNAGKIVIKSTGGAVTVIA